MCLTSLLVWQDPTCIWGWALGLCGPVDRRVAWDSRDLDAGPGSVTNLVCDRRQVASLCSLPQFPHL